MDWWNKEGTYNHFGGVHQKKDDESNKCRKINCSQWKTNVLAFLNNKMHQTLKKGRKHKVALASEMLFKVKYSTKSWVVNLQKHTCDCGLWQISGLSCSHSIPCIVYIRLLMRSLWKRGISKMLLKYDSSFAYKSKWPHVEVEEIVPPKVQRPHGRPKTCRRKTLDEPPAHKRRFTIFYKFCRVISHNKRCCPANLANAHKKTRNKLVRQWLKHLIISSKYLFSFVHK